MPIRVFVADDHQVVRDGVRYRVERDPELICVGEAEDGPSLFRELPNADPVDVLVLDLNMPQFTPLQAVSMLGEQYPHMKILVLTIHDEIDLIGALLEAGAMGYLPKETVTGELVKAIKQIANGQLWIDREMGSALLQRRRPDTSTTSGRERFARLSQREKEIARLLARGYSTREIESTLGITYETVRTHARNIYHKLEVNSRAELILLNVTLSEEPIDV